MSEGDLTQIIADCERRLWQLEKEIREAGLRENATIKHNLECAKQTAILCIDNLASGNLNNARLFADITLLRTNFAAKAFESELTEALLGETDFLELSEDWQRLADNALSEMERILISVAGSLNSKT